MNRAATPHITDGSSPVDGVPDTRSNRGNSVPGGSSVWDLDTAPESATADPVVSREVLPAEPTPDSDPTPTTQVVAEHSTDDPDVARSVPVERRAAVRTSRPNKFGLIGVATAAALMVFAALWFLAGGRGGPADDGAQAAPTLPPVAPSLDDLADDAAVNADSTPDAQTLDTEEPAPESNVEAAVVQPAVTEPGIDAPDTPVRDTVEPELIELAPTETDAPDSSDGEPAGDSAVTAPVASPVDGRWVEIVPSVEPCRFGSACLVAGYVAHGFDVVPGAFVCEFASGSRFEFGATTSAVDYACATGSLGDSITIEIDGVRSETVVHG